MSSVKITNKERFYAKLRTTVPKIKINLTDANEKSATEMVQMAQRFVPVAGAEDPDPGILRDSIRMGPGQRETSFVVEAGGPSTTKHGAGGTYDYANAQEFGTQNMPAQPFFWPSYRVTKKKHKGRVSRTIGRALKEAGF